MSANRRKLLLVVVSVTLLAGETYGHNTRPTRARTTGHYS
jgi:hypothetical protein